MMNYNLQAPASNSNLLLPENEPNLQQFLSQPQ